MLCRNCLQLAIASEEFAAAPPLRGVGVARRACAANANPFKQEGWEEWIAGVMLCEFGAFVYAAGIVTQRYALEMGRKLAVRRKPFRLFGHKRRRPPPIMQTLRV